MRQRTCFQNRQQSLVDPATLWITTGDASSFNAIMPFDCKPELR